MSGIETELRKGSLSPLSLRVTSRRESGLQAQTIILSFQSHNKRDNNKNNDECPPSKGYLLICFLPVTISFASQ